MKRFDFQEPGTVLHIDGRPHVVVATSEDAVTLVDQTTTVATERPIVELYTLYEEGRLEHQAPAHLKRDGSVEPGRPSVSLSAMTKAQREAVLDRLAIIRHIDKLPMRSRSMIVEKVDPYSGISVSRSVLEHELAAISHCRKLASPVSRASYFRWRQRFLKHSDAGDLQPRFEDRGRKQFLNPAVREAISIVLHDQVKLARSGRAAGIHLKSTPSKILAKVQLPPGTTPPSRATVMRQIASLPAYDQDVIRHGKKTADLNFRMAQTIDRPDLPLDRVEYDETETGVVVVDDIVGVPLGMPNMSYFVDSITECPLGFYIGLEQCSDVSTMAALRHTCSPKAYMKTLYPDIKGSIPGGVPRGAVFDRSLTAFGSSLESVAADLLIDYRYAKAFAPNLKGAVENFHRILRGAAFEHLGGYKLPPKIRPDWYDPAKHAVIPFSKLVQAAHAFIADTYLAQPDNALKLSPLQRFRDGSSLARPQFLNSARDLDLVFGVLRSGNLDHRGVRWENGWYRGEGMDEHRRKLGASVAVRVKVNMADIGQIYWEDYQGVWRKAFHSNYAYASGKSLHLDKIIVAFARKHFGSDGDAALSAAHKTYVELARESLLHIQGVRESARLMKALHLGTDTMLASPRASAPRAVSAAAPRSGVEQVMLPAPPAPPTEPIPAVEHPETPGTCEAKRLPITRRSFPKEYV